MITRFAPSLTGYLHLGHVLHLLYVWSVARRYRARVLCRIEDHDLSRRRPEYEAAILEDLQWLGFTPDLGIHAGNRDGASAFRQSDNADHYAAMLRQLQEQGLVYGCECSRRQILEQQTDGTGELCYPGTCADKNLPLEGHTVRFRISHHRVAFEDLALGTCHQAPIGQCGDFSLRDRQGQWTYQFCCVCDDIRHGVNLVVRGEDILSSTGRQILLFEAFGTPPPRYHHHPLVYDARGEKLSKRQHAESITSLREAGMTAEELLGRALHAGGWLESLKPMHMDAALERVSGRAADSE